MKTVKSALNVATLINERAEFHSISVNSIEIFEDMIVVQFNDDIAKFLFENISKTSLKPQFVNVC